MTPQEFFSANMPYARRVSERTGLDPRLVLSQAALETGYGRSAPNNNYFGIKGGNQSQKTKEFRGGQMVDEVANFRGYGSVGDSFDGYADFILSNPRYGDVLRSGSLSDQIAAMGASGYATDPNYARKLSSIASGINLDGGVAADTMTALGKTLPPQPQRGILATPQERPEPMQKQQPRGLLGSLGLQKMQDGAEGETGQRFYQRDSFKDTAAKMGQAFAALGSNPGVQKFTNDVAGQRTEAKSRNKTIEYLRANGMDDMANMVEAGDMSAGGVMSAIMQKRMAVPKGVFKQVSGAELGMEGPDAGKMFNLSPDGKVTAIGGGGSVIEIDMGKGDMGEFQKLDAKMLSGVSEVGMQAQRSLAQIDRLETLLGAAPAGAVGNMQLIAGNFGIKSEGLDDLQAATALINTLIPQQRQPGSGPMSDADLDLFKQSLPRIINSPNGNAMILQTMRGIAQYDAMGASIVQQYRSGDLSQPETFKALQARKDPFAQIRQSMQSEAGGAGGGSVLTDDDLKYLEGDG